MSSFLERFARLSDAKRTLFEHRLEEVLRLDEPVAIVGMACRLPGAPDLEAYWRLLATGVDAVGDVPAARWDAEAFYHREPRRRGKMSSRQGAFLARLDELDAGFFGISPREAELLDPQQRLLLELSWEALEDAGLGDLLKKPLNPFAQCKTRRNRQCCDVNSSSKLWPSGPS